MKFEYETDRMVLRVLNTNYVAEVLAFQNRNRDLFERYEPTRPHDFYTSAYQHMLLKSEFRQATQFSNIRFYVFLKGQPRTIIGTVCMHDVRREPYACCEIGYKFDASYQHRGYATEAVAKLVRIAFFELRLHRVFARVMPDNTPSIHLLESIGFAPEGLERDALLIRGHWEDHIRYALLNSDQPSARTQ